MINKNELLCVVDENDNPLEPKSREEAHARGLWHRVAHIWIFNEGNVLCQQRSLLKDKHPGKWEPFFGGHLSLHQEYIDGAIKELGEELGVTVSPEELRFYKIIKSDTSREFKGVYLLEKNVNINEVILEEDEVSQVAWMSIADIQKYITQNESGWSLPQYSSELLSSL